MPNDRILQQRPVKQLPLFLLQFLQQFLPARFFRILPEDIAQGDAVVPGVGGTETLQAEITSVRKIPVLLLAEGINDVDRYDEPLAEELTLDPHIHAQCISYRSLRVGKPVERKTCIGIHYIGELVTAVQR